jgi:hypothetical protein
MDKMDILITSMETKLNTAENELVQAQVNLDVATKFSGRLGIEEQIAGLKARDDLVRGYLKKGKKRLNCFKERYKELMVQGWGGRGYGGNASAGLGGACSSGGGGSGSSSCLESAQSPPSLVASASLSPPTLAPPTLLSSAKSWRNEGFMGLYGQLSSGSQCSCKGQGQEASADDGLAGVDRPSTNVGQQPDQQQQGHTAKTAYGSSGSGSSSDTQTTTTSVSNKLITPLEPWVPPHRQTQSLAKRDTQVKKRLQDLKVDDSFNKLKR